jgi:phosphoribosylformimino-5-aminoimidazole carboxamide ribotide isomerase
MKIIPAIDLMNGQVVRLVHGDPNQKTIYSDDPIGIAKRWEDYGSDVIHIVDLDATLGNGSDNISIIRDIASTLSVPIQVGGGLRSRNTIINMAKIVSRVVLGTIAFSNKSILKELIDVLGREKIVISVDHYDGYIATHGWQKKTNKELHDAVNDFLQMGLTEFLLTNIKRDGTMQGPDIKYLKQISNIPRVNVIASGGISSIEDVKEVSKFDPYGVILGKALYENKVTIQEARNFSSN